MPENKTAALRKMITSDFLRTIVWVDDEIKPDEKDKSGDPFRDFFYPIARDFQAEGFLVHLHPFDSSLSSEHDMFSANDSSVESMIKLVKKADIIILDWHLGTTTPENSTRLLKELAKDSASRFVVVLSQFADKFAEEIEAAGLIRPVSEEQENAESRRLLFKVKNGHWANKNGMHLTVLSKNVPTESASRSISAKEIVDSIHDLISSSYSDYLQWVTLEIASKIRSKIPSWLQAVPKGTDVAVLGELLSETTEAREFIPEFLLDDLVQQISKSYQLKVLDSEYAKVSDWGNRPYVLNVAPQSREDKFVHLHKDITELETKDLDKILSQAAQEDRRLFIQSHSSLTQFCENISGQFEDVPPEFGAVYKIITGVSEDIYVCVSQPCDCLRKSKLILIKGSVSSEAKQRETMVTFQGRRFRFDAGAENLSTEVVQSDDGPRRFTNFRRVGQLRLATARRISSRFWGETTRPAVNLPNFARKERAKE